MLFPFSSSGTIEMHVSGQSGFKRIVLAVTSAVRSCEPTSLLVVNGVVSFHAGIFRFAGNWNHLAYISSGQISFSQRGDLTVIHYYISSMQWFAVSNIMAGLVFAMGFPFGMAIFCGVMVFGSNAGYAYYRFPRFLRMAAEKTISPNFTQRKR